MVGPTRDTLQLLAFTTTPATRQFGDKFAARTDVDVVAVESVATPAETLTEAPDVDCVVCDHDPPAVDATAVAAAASTHDCPVLVATDRAYGDLDGDPLATGVDAFHRVVAGDVQADLAVHRLESIVTAAERDRELARERTRRDGLFADPDRAIGILDTDGTLLDINDRALRFAGMFGGAATVTGKPFWETPWVTRSTASADEVRAAMDRVERGETVRTVVSARDANHNLIEVEIGFRPMTRDGAVVGAVVTGEDRTQLRSQERRLHVLARILRHNVRNDLSAINGHTDFIQQRASGEVGTHADMIQQVTDDLIEKSELARRLEQALTVDRSPVPRVDVAEILASELDRLERDHPEVDIERSLSESQFARAESGIDVAIRALLENAVEHGSTSPQQTGDAVEHGSTSPQQAGDAVEHGSQSSRDDDGEATGARLTVTMESVAAIDGGSGPRQPEQAVEIRIADEGPGIPDHEVAVLDEGVETALEHGSGLGLWAANWIVEDSGGTLSLEENDPHGTVAVITLTAANGDE